MYEIIFDDNIGIYDKIIMIETEIEKIASSEKNAIDPAKKVPFIFL